MLRVGFAAVRVLLVVNPAASSVTTRARAGVERILRDAVPTDVVETTRRGHAAEIARDAVDDGYDVIAVFAGDGTLNEAGGALAGSTVAIAPLPGGSTNVFARTLGIA
jgi:diacylglycerol kinase family enzyme